ncbi:MAG: BREX-1 system phosphatase PglZ type B [Planctomycetaceae bacterium]
MNADHDSSTDTVTTAAPTLFDTLIAAVAKSADYNRDDTVPPAAILWTDEKREWERLVPRLREALPQFLTLGPYQPPQRSGPAIWLRCVLAGQIAAVTLPAGVVPIVYLPGVSRATLRATEECPPELAPLAELQYRGVIWSQVNAKDWTLAAYLQTAKGGLGLTLAKDLATAAALRRSVDKLADVPLSSLLAKSNAGELNASFFDSLVTQDPVDDLLLWMSQSANGAAAGGSPAWEALCSRCVANLGFDPVRDGALAAAEQLGLHRQLAWKAVWERFTQAPARYPGVETLLRRAKPQPKRGTLTGIKFFEEPWPQDNEAEETALREKLLAVASLPVDEARREILKLEGSHAQRRGWVWAKLDRAPLAAALQPLAQLAQHTTTPLAGATLAGLIEAYTATGWQADAAALAALAKPLPPAEETAVVTALTHIYTPWLRDAAELFQARAAETPLPGREQPRLPDQSPGCCVLFVDGLRYDVGRQLAALLIAQGHTLVQHHHTVPLPSVTPTAKPAISPVAGQLAGTEAGEDFLPGLAADGKPLTVDRFRRLLDQAGVQFLAPGEVGEPSGQGWTEFGKLDAQGHAEGAHIARRIPELLTGVVDRIKALLSAGWNEVRVVTDHGWLLLPGGLPKAELPLYLTTTRWRRCAVIHDHATVDLPRFAWFWNGAVQMVSPRGIDCFLAGEEYTHGGLSLQECVVPQLLVTAPHRPTVSVTIESVKWTGLRCRVKLSGEYAGCRVDLRDRAADPRSSIAQSKPLGEDGTASLVVNADEDDCLGEAKTLVVLDAAGLVVAKQAVTVGE